MEVVLMVSSHFYFGRKEITTLDIYQVKCK